MDNAIYQFMDCDGTKDGPPQQYPDLSQIADFSAGEQTQCSDVPSPRVKKFYPGVLDSKYMQAVVRGGREGLLQFRENPRPGYPVPYPWPDWFDHETGGSSAGIRKRPVQNAYPKGCTSQQPAGVPGCTGAAGGNRVPSMYDPSQYAAACATADPQRCGGHSDWQPAQVAGCDQPVLVPCPPPAQQQQPPPSVQEASHEQCIPCSAAPVVYANPADPQADCSPPRPQWQPPPQQQQPRQRAILQSTDKNFVPSYLHEPENMAKIIAHDYQRQWVDERDTWETSHATTNDQQHLRMLSRCTRGENK